jgi:5-methylcytosine-specific restriction endonuclease McrA
VGVPLNDQELLNAVYSGPFTTLGKTEFSNSQNANVAKWGAYVSGSANRQDFWERALEWVSKGKDNIGGYMSSHRTDTNIKEVQTYFNTVIDWVSTVFTDVETEMRGLEWGRLYETYHSKPFKAEKVSQQVQELYGDPYVKNRKGIFEYILGGSTQTKLLNVRVFDDATSRSTYEKQTKAATKAETSNCPLCALGHEASKTKIWTIAEMEADHVTAWSKGGATSASNCQMLCKTHNRAKGNS